jgi:hypothetical protein
MPKTEISQEVKSQLIELITINQAIDDYLNYGDFSSIRNDQFNMIVSAQESIKNRIFCIRLEQKISQYYFDLIKEKSIKKLYGLDGESSRIPTGVNHLIRYSDIIMSRANQDHWIFRLEPTTQ